MPKFIVDFMLGRLARWLRIFGYDAEYYSGVSRTGLLYQSLKEKRILLTRDHVLSRKRAWQFLLIKSNFFLDQLKQIKDETGIEFDSNRLFSRCTFCNVVVETIDKQKIKGKVPEYVYATHDEFSHCRKCKRIYWAGTHLELLQQQCEGKELWKKTVKH